VSYLLAPYRKCSAQFPRAHPPGWWGGALDVLLGSRLAHMSCSRGSSTPFSSSHVRRLQGRGGGSNGGGGEGRAAEAAGAGKSPETAQLLLLSWYSETLYFYFSLGDVWFSGAKSNLVRDNTTCRQLLCPLSGPWVPHL